MTSYGYDFRVGYKFKVFSPVHATEIDPKNFDPAALVEVDLTPHTKHNWIESPLIPNTPAYVCTRCKAGTDDPERSNHYFGEGTYGKCTEVPNFIRIPPHSFVLGETVETFTIPRDVLCVVVGKSTLARCGLILNVTPGEPEWSGKWTIEISNTTDLPSRIYCGEGIGQCLFFRTDGYEEATRNALIDKWAKTDFHQYKMLKDAIAAGTCKVSYADKSGKYQSQTGLTLPTIDKKGS